MVAHFLGAEMSKKVRWQNRVENFREEVERLVAGKEFKWKLDIKLKNIPEIPGVYVIIEKDCYLYVGETKDLRERLWKHGRANISNSRFHKLLLEKRNINSKEDRKKFVLDRCSFKILEVKEAKEYRKSLEEFTINVLKPELQLND